MRGRGAGGARPQILRVITEARLKPDLGAIRAQSSPGGAPVFSLLSHALGSHTCCPSGLRSSLPRRPGRSGAEPDQGPAGPELFPYPKVQPGPRPGQSFGKNYNPQARPSAGDFGRSEGHEPGPLHAAWFVLKQPLQFLPAFYLGSSGRVAPGEFLCPQDKSARGFRARNLA